MGDIQLVQVWHLHQPVTQVKKWVDAAVARAYAPLLEIYARHPAVRYNLNITGSLVDQLEKWAPALLRGAAQAVGTGQMEPTTTAYYQPIIPFIPRAHAVAQIQRNTQRLEGLFHRRPRAAWVPERAWEPSMSPVFQEAGVEAVLLDDHLLRSPRPRGWKYSPWEATGGDRSVAVFLIDEDMRYLIPWMPVAEVLRRLEEIANQGLRNAVVTFADDGEKMGLWPGTEEIHPWLEEFLAGVEERPWLKPTTLEAYLRDFGTAGEGNLSPGSYAEMEEWCFGDLRNWLRHPLIRDMYARLNLTIAGIPEGSTQEEVLRAEVNDPYWYARRMTYHRQEVYHNLLLAERGNPWTSQVKRGDLNGDGHDEALLQDDRQRIFVGHDGRIYEWDDREVAHNFVNTGFLDLGYGEDKPLKDKLVFALPRRNCLTDFVDGDPLFAGGVRVADSTASFAARRGDLEVVKALALADGVLTCQYRLRNTGPGPLAARFAVELCFTPPTDTVDASVRDYHRQVFDYAGTVVDRPVEFASDGPGVAWSSVQDNEHGVVAGAAWRPGAIELHTRGIAAEGVALTPAFPVVLAPGEVRALDLRVAAGRGDHARVAGLLKALR